MTKTYLNKLTYAVIGCCIEVHRELGPGLLESVYQKCLKQEFYLKGIKYQSELSVGINYKGKNLDADLRSDFLIEDLLVVEIKAMDGILPIHEAQLLTYMKLLEKPKGILVNFNCSNIFKEGQKTFVNELFRTLED
jgi:GxxExxY protein